MESHKILWKTTPKAVENSRGVVENFGYPVENGVENGLENEHIRFEFR